MYAAPTKNADRYCHQLEEFTVPVGAPNGRPLTRLDHPWPWEIHPRHVVLIAVLHSTSRNGKTRAACMPPLLNR